MFLIMLLPKSLAGSVPACTSYHTSAVTYQHAPRTALQCHNIDNHNISVHHRENIRYFTTCSMEYSIPDRLILPHLVKKNSVHVMEPEPCVRVCCTVLQTFDIPVFPGVHLQ